MTKHKNSRGQNSHKSELERKLLEKVGRKIHRDLHDLDKPIEWLSFESETARSTIRSILNGESNTGILTLHRISKALGYKDICFLCKKRTLKVF